MNSRLLRAARAYACLAAAIAWVVCTPPAYAKHGARLHYLKAGRPNPAELLAPPPLPGSAEQAVDMSTVVSMSKACSTNDIAQAFSEKKFSIFTFAPAIGVFLVPGRLPQTEAFFESIQHDAASVTDLGKDYWKRPRPYTIETNLAAGKLEKSYSYPSGHAAEAMVLALVLADLFPDHRECILEVGRNIGWHRLWIGRHYPTDIYAGRVLAQAIVQEMRSNSRFRHDLARVKAELASVATRAIADAVPKPVVPTNRAN